MPSKNNRTKMTGDTHFADTESEFSVEDRRQESAQADAGGEDNEARTGNGGGRARDSGGQSSKEPKQR